MKEEDTLDRAIFRKKDKNFGAEKRQANNALKK